MKENMITMGCSSVLSMVLLGITGSVVIWLLSAIGGGVLSYVGRELTKWVHEKLKNKKEEESKS